ncbi:hypothetical protein HK100_011195, partial [Physocladia obscura]
MRETDVVYAPPLNAQPPKHSDRHSSAQQMHIINVGLGLNLEDQNQAQSQSQTQTQLEHCYSTTTTQRSSSTSTSSTNNLSDSSNSDNESESGQSETSQEFATENINFPSFYGTFEAQPFRNASCTSFAAFYPAINTSLEVLLHQQNTWDAVNLLLLPLSALVDLTKIHATGIDEDQDDHECTLNGVASPDLAFDHGFGAEKFLRSVKSGKSKEFKAPTYSGRTKSASSYTSPSPSPIIPYVTSHSSITLSGSHSPSQVMRKSSSSQLYNSSQSFAIPTLKKKTYSRLSRMSTYLGVSSSRSVQMSIHGDINSKSPVGQLNGLLSSRTVYIIAEIDVLEVYKLYQSKRARLGLMKFAMFFLQHISELLSRASLPINGFYFSNCFEAHLLFPSLQWSLVRLFGALRESFTITGVPVVLLLDEYGLTSWDHVRDLINGIVLTNCILETCGNLRIRSNMARSEFDKQMKLLKNEISLREDFSVFGIEIVEGPLTQQLHAHVIKFYTGMGFKFWISKSVGIDLVEDIVPNTMLTVGSDMLEIATAPAVVKCLKLGEEKYTKLMMEVSETDEIELMPSDWDEAIKNLKSSSDFWDSNQLLLINLRKSDFSESTAYIKNQFPEAPNNFQQLSSNQIAEIVHLLQETPQIKLLDLQKSKSCGTSARASHKHIGTSVNPKRQKRLENLILNVMRDLKSRDLLAAVRYNNDLGTDTDAFAAPFKLMLSILDGITHPLQSTPSTKWILSLFGEKMQSTVVQGIRMLAAGLRQDTVSVWCAAKVGFIPKDGIDADDIPYDPVWAVCEETGGKLVIYLSDGHPRIEEAVLHIFMKHSFGWRSGLCVMIEALVSAQMNKEEYFQIPIPVRILHEIKTTHRAKMLSYVRNSADVMTAIPNFAESDGEANYLTSVCKYVNTCVEYLLITQEKFTDLMKTYVFAEFIPRNSAEEALVLFLGEQTLLKDGMATVISICTTIDKLLREDQGSRNYNIVLCYIIFAIYKACKRCAYLELKLAVTNMSTQILPDKDQVAVCLEMATTQTTLQQIFNLSSLQLAPFFHRIQRELIKEVEETKKVESSVDHVPEFSFKNLDFSMVRHIGNSYIYIYPILIDMALNAAIGSGLFFSNRMDTVTLKAATIAFLVSFPFIGGLMNSFGRSILFMILYAILVAFRDPDVPFYKSAGPVTCLQSIFLLIPSAIICRLAFQDVSNSFLVWGIYTGMMALSVIFMFYKYSKIAKMYLAWPSAVKVTSKEDIFRVYETVTEKPTRINNDESVEQLDRRIRLWERSAFEWFAEALRKAIKSPKALVTDSVLKKRLSQWNWERPLMAWFMQRSSVDPRSIKPFSQDWDALLKQAVDALTKKYQVEKLNRGAFITFLDKWAILIATGQVGVFMPNANTLNLTITFATMFLLFSAGFLEITISNCAEQVNQFKYATMSTVRNPLELIAQYQAFTDAMYRTELRKLVVRAAAVFVVITIIITVSFGLRDDTHTVFLYYAIASFNYCGLLVGLFNKIFININENYLNNMLAAAIIISTAISAIVIKVTSNNSFALIATGLSCWGFGISCLFVRNRERSRSPYYEISIGPNLRTSGQRMIGYVSNSLSERSLKTYSEMLLKEKDTFALCLASSSTGMAILMHFDNLISKTVAIDKSSLLHTAAQDLVFVLKSASQKFRSGYLKVHEVPGVLHTGNVSYAAIGTNLSTIDSMDIFVSGTGNISSEERVVLLGEAIAHEVAESLGLSHSTACVIEILLSSYSNESFMIPRRIMYQLKKCDSTQTDRIVSKTQNEISKCSTLGLDIDQCWLYLTHTERKWFFSASLVWNEAIRTLDQEISEDKDQNPLYQLCLSAPSNMEEKIRNLLGRSRSETISLWLMCCHAMMMGNLAIKISDCITNGDGFPSFKFPNSLSKPPKHKISDALNIHFAVAYFALTCDVSFGKEVSELPAITRRPLCALFWLDERIFNFLNHTLLFSRDTFIKDFKLQSEQGVSQIQYFQKTGKQTVCRIDVFVNGEKNTSIVSSEVSDLDELTSKKYLGVNRYIGNKPVNWEPRDSDKIFATAILYKGSKTTRVLEERFLDEKGAVQKSNLYSYASKSSKFPTSRLVFNQDIPTRNNIITGPAELHVLANSNDLAEIHWFYIEGPHAGLVQSGIFYRTHKITNEKVKISVVFQYEIPAISNIPKWGIFRSEDEPNWEIVIEYAPFSDFGEPMQPWSVRYRNGSSEGCRFISFDYSHPKHITTKTILTTTNELELSSSAQGLEVPTPEEILDDYFGVMSIKPLKTVQSSCEVMTNKLKPRVKYGLHKTWPFIRINSIEYSGSTYSTREKRDMLWTAWRAGKIPGVFARYFDASILKSEAALTKYWKFRSAGNVFAAREYLRENQRLLSNVLYVADIPAKRTRLQIRYSDLAVFGSGGDSEHISSFDSGGGEIKVEGPEILEAICLDSGTWPTGGGGVGSCRRDVVDSLSRVRWTAIAEIAGAELEHKDYQIEKNINAIIYLPIFDNDMGSPMENIYKTFPFRSLRDRNVRTTDKIVSLKFVPIIVELIHACMTEDLETRRVQQDEQLILSFYDYFKTHDWRKSWDHSLTQRMWMATFLEKAKEMENDGRLLKHESPTLAHISMLFTLFSRLLLILSREIPNVPVVHVSHHGTQSLIAVVAKVVHGSSVIIWDHGMLWRERLFALGRDPMPSFAQIGFSGLTRLCTRLAYNRADYVTPCTNVQNVMWAAHLAGGKYLNDFERVALLSKCSAVLNGMNLKRFSIKRELARKTPTAVMLSHISPVKDVMNAIKAAYHIVHEFKVSNYELHVYGSPNTDLSYT